MKINIKENLFLKTLNAEDYFVVAAKVDRTSISSLIPALSEVVRIKKNYLLNISGKWNDTQM